MRRWACSSRQGCYYIKNVGFIFSFCLFSRVFGTFKNIPSELKDEKIRYLNVILSLVLSEADKVKKQFCRFDFNFW